MSLRSFLTFFIKQLLHLLWPRFTGPSFYHRFQIVVPVLAGLAVLANFRHMNQYTLATEKEPEIDKKPSTLTSNCDSLLKYGRYTEDANESPLGWQPDGCAIKTYRSIYEDDLRECFRPGDEIIFLGDSTIRQVFWGVVNTLYRGHLQKMDYQANTQVAIEGVTLTLYWSSYFNETNADIIRNISRDGMDSEYKATALEFHKDKSYSPETYLYMTAGSWFAGMEHPSDVANNYRVNTMSLLQDIDDRVDDAFERVYFAPPLIPHYDYLDDNRKISMTHEQIHSMEEIADELFGYVRTNDTIKAAINPALYTGGVRYRTRQGRTDEISAYYVPVFNELSAENHEGIHDDMGIHYAERGFLTQANILLNHICNNRIAQETGRPPAGATCCVEYEDYTYNVKATIFMPSVRRILDKALFIMPLFALVFSAYRCRSEAVIPVLKAVITAVVVEGLVTSWARISNETQLISKVSIHYSWAEMMGLLQIWAFISIVPMVFSKHNYSYGIEKSVIVRGGVAPLARFRLSKSLLLELQGICVSLLLIIQYTGYNFIPQEFDGELFTRIVTSVWSLAELYMLCVEYFDSFSPVQMHGQFSFANITLAQAYSLPLPVVAKALARVVTLPMLLSVSVSYSTRDSLPGNFAPSFIDPACKLAFWYTLVYFAFPIVNLVTQAYLKDEDEHLKSFRSANPTVHGLPSTNLIAHTCFLVVGFSIPQVFAPMILQVVEINVTNNSLRAFLSILEDYWIMMFAVWGGLYSCTQTHHTTLEDSDAAISPGPISVTAAAVALVGLYDIAQFAFAYYLPRSESGATHPISFIDRHQTSYELLLDARGRNYNTLVHTVFVLSSVIAYLVLRLGVLHYTRQETDHHKRYRYMSCWVELAKFSYEMLELYPYVFLAVSGTVRLYYLPTGVVHSSLVTRTYSFVSREYVFPYFEWRMVEKVRKSVSVGLAGSVLILLSQCCALVWNNRVLKVGEKEGEEK